MEPLEVQNPFCEVGDSIKFALLAFSRERLYPLQLGEKSYKTLEHERL